MKKLLLIAPDSVHTYNFIDLIDGYFDEVLLITNRKNPSYRGRSLEFNFSFRNPLTILPAISQIRSIAREFNPNIVHLHQAGTGAWITLQALKNEKINSILTVWGSDILLTPHKGFLYRKLIMQILKRAGYFTADANYLGDQLKKLAARPIDLTIVNFGIDPVCKTDEELEQTVSEKESIIYSNRLHKKLYRIDTVIRTFADFHNKSSNKEWRLVIAGDGEESESLMKLAEELGISSHTTFVGWLNKEENSSWYRKAKIFVSVPESDATSISMLEAMSAGCIPVISDLPSKWEWIKNGVNGILTPALNVADFERGLDLAGSDAVKINHRLIREKATKERSRQLFFNLYDRVLSL